MKMGFVTGRGCTPSLSAAWKSPAGRGLSPQASEPCAPERLCPGRSWRPHRQHRRFRHLQRGPLP